MAEEQKNGQNMIWQIVIAVLVLAIVGAMFAKGGLNFGVSKETAVKDAMKYVNENFRAPESPEFTYDAKTISEAHGMYTVKIKTKDDKGAEVEVGTLSITKDGKAIFPSEPIEIKKADDKAAANKQASGKEVPKADKPDVKLFVMSFCPFGLQAEKAILPAMDLLKGKADIGIYYVNYIMHGKKEADQNIRQYCVEKEQGDKYNAYLTCFATYDLSACQKAASAIKDPASAQAAADACYNPVHNACAAKAGVDTGKVETCYTKTFAELKLSSNAKDYEYSQDKGFPQFALHDELNKQYGVQGSPTLVINGVEASNVTRSPEGFKAAICNAFNNKPAECDQKLSESAASAGMGPNTGNAASSNASCN